MWISCESKISSVNRKLTCAILDSSQIHTSSSLRSSLVVLPDSKNMGIAVEIVLLSCMRAEIYVIPVIPYLLPVMAAIFDFHYTQTSVRILTCLFVLPDPENMGIAIGILFLSHLEAEI